MTTTVAVTGADGFIGSHLVETLVAAGYRVRAMIQYNSFGSWGWLDEVESATMSSVEVVAGDIRDRDSVRGLLTGGGQRLPPGGSCRHSLLLHGDGVIRRNQCDRNPQHP